MEINLKKRRVLVTGGTGFVGSHLIEELVRIGAHVVTTNIELDPRSYFLSKKLNKRVKVVQCDICDFKKLTNLIKRTKPEYVFHLAAQPLVEVAFKDPKQTLDSNVVGTINLLEGLRQFAKPKAIIVASSDKAYGKLTKKKYIETDPLRGDHPYEVSKSATDLISLSYFKSYGLPVVTTRFGNIYGEGDLYFSRIVPGIMESLIKNKILRLRSNGRFMRDYLHVKDVVAGYLLLAKKIQKVKGEAFNFGSEETLSVLELIKKLEKLLKKKIKYKIMNNEKNEIPYQSLNYTKARKIIGWRPRESLTKSAESIYEWYSSNM